MNNIYNINYSSDMKDRDCSGGRFRNPPMPDINSRGDITNPLHGKLSEFPLRILVPSETLGVIIGRKGSNIKTVREQCKVRVNIHTEHNDGAPDTAISVYGSTEDCTRACKKILEYMIEDSEKNKKGDVALRILAHNNLVGRIIGKEGAIVNKIEEQSGAKVSISSINTVNPYNLERTITIQGGLEEIMKAENSISSKLRQKYESDLRSAVSHQPPHAPMPQPNNISYQLEQMSLGGGAPDAPGSYSYSSFYNSCNFGAPHCPSGGKETTYFYIPNELQSAIFGNGGSYLPEVMKATGAIVQVDKNIVRPEGYSLGTIERRLTIIGSPEAQWKAQYMIYKKISDCFSFDDEFDPLIITTEVLIPSFQVSTIFGGHEWVCKLLLNTGADISLKLRPPEGADKRVVVSIKGPLLPVQYAQERIRSIISKNGPHGPPNGIMSGSQRRKNAPGCV